MKLAVLSFNTHELYFRKGFCEASERVGIPVLFIEWSKIICFTQKDRHPTILPVNTPVVKLAHLIREFSQGDDTIIINSMVFSNVHKAIWLRRNLREMLWVYDVFDYFFYDSTGKRFLIAKIKDLINRIITDKIMVLSKPLLDVYPGAFHLDNASHLAPGNRKQQIPRKQIVSIASFNERFNFDLVEKVANLLPDHSFHLYGWVLNNSPKILQTISRLTGNHPNIIYHGSYTNSQLDSILDDYDIGLLPYINNNILTQYINPDKLYHYLCKGLEVVSTPIPQAMEMREHLHLATNATEFAERIKDIADKRLRNNHRFHLDHNWELRVTEFLQQASPGKN